MVEENRKFNVNTIKKHLKQYGCETFVELNTEDSMIEELRSKGDYWDKHNFFFKRMISSYSDEEKYIEEKSKFNEKIGITILHGDNIDILNTIITAINGKAIFWLESDSETLLEELEIIFASKKKHVIMFNNAHLLYEENSKIKIEEVTKFVNKKDKSYLFSENNNNIITCAEKIDYLINQPRLVVGQIVYLDGDTEVEYFICNILLKDTAVKIAKVEDSDKSGASLGTLYINDLSRLKIK